MKTLLLLRHGKSRWDESAPDHDRSLRGRGRRDAVRVGRFLALEGLAPDWIWSSTATRAADTARRVVEAGELDITVEELHELYGADVDDILEVVSRTPDWAGTVMVVGHNPGMEEAATALTRREFSMTTCMLVAIVLEIEDWSEIVRRPRGRMTGIWHPSELPADSSETEMDDADTQDGA